MFTFAYVNMFTVACRVSKLLRVLGGRVEAGGFFFQSWVLVRGCLSPFLEGAGARRDKSRDS